MASIDLCTTASSRRLSIVKSELANGQGLKEGFRISSFSKRQQRKMKVLLLKASRPILRRSNQKSSEASSPSKAATAVEEESTTDPLPLLALEAMEEARVLRRMQSMNGNPLNSALGAVDWMLDLAHGVQYDWPMFAWLKEDTKKVNAPQSFLETIEEERELTEEEMPQYARCDWPRKMLVSTVTPVETSDPHAARCSWPRPTATPQMSARCAWPRTTSDVPPTEEVTADRKLLEKIYAGDANLGYAHCAWPRKSLPTPVLGPRCPWPRNVSTMAGNSIVAFVAEDKDEVVAARCIWPRAPAKSVSPPQLALETVAGPRCAWPRPSRVMAATRDVTENNSVQTAHTESILGPRCPWPRKQA